MGARNIQTIVVTPEIAHQWIQRRHKNQRPVNTDRVQYYARQMITGEWGQSNDAICFDKSGWLVNGLTRLSAVVASGCTVTFDVKTDLSDNEVLHIDDGRSRSAKDTIRFATGRAGSSAQVVRAMIHGCRYNAPGSSRRRASPTELVKCYEMCQESIESCGAEGQGWSAAARAVCCLAHFYETDVARKEEIIRFAAMARVVAEPLPGTRGGVTARALRTALSRNSKFGSSGRERHWRLTQAALRAFLNGRDIVLVREANQDYWPCLLLTGFLK